jgi:hypothetical protein
VVLERRNTYAAKSTENEDEQKYAISPSQVTRRLPCTHAPQPSTTVSGHGYHCNGGWRPINRGRKVLLGFSLHYPHEVADDIFLPQSCDIVIIATLSFALILLASPPMAGNLSVRFPRTCGLYSDTSSGRHFLISFFELGSGVERHGQRSNRPPQQNLNDTQSTSAWR